ncbi:hypothetical protein SNEBB_000953 [Seison nebaliae]|nr:hypothetical protein SNEBB_000953 [Seison nebaliae]
MINEDTITETMSVEDWKVIPLDENEKTLDELVPIEKEKKLIEQLEIDSKTIEEEIVKENSDAPEIVSKTREDPEIESKTIADPEIVEEKSVSKEIEDEKVELKENELKMETDKKEDLKIDSEKKENLETETEKKEELEIDLTKEENLEIDLIKEENLEIDLIKEENLEIDLIKEENLKIDLIKEENLTINPKRVEESKEVSELKREGVMETDTNFKWKERNGNMDKYVCGKTRHHLSSNLKQLIKHGLWKPEEETMMLHPEIRKLCNNRNKQENKKNHSVHSPTRFIPGTKEIERTEYGKVQYERSKVKQAPIKKRRNEKRKNRNHRKVEGVSHELDNNIKGQTIHSQMHQRQTVKNLTKEEIRKETNVGEEKWWHDDPLSKNTKRPIGDVLLRLKLRELFITDTIETNSLQHTLNAMKNK